MKQEDVKQRNKVDFHSYFISKTTHHLAQLRRAESAKAALFFDLIHQHSYFSAPFFHTYKPSSINTLQNGDYRIPISPVILEFTPNRHCRGHHTV